MDVQDEGDLSFAGDIDFNGEITFDGDIVVNGDVSFLGEVGGIEINELVDVDTEAQPPQLNQVLMDIQQSLGTPNVSPTGGADVTSVNSQTGDVVLDADSIDDSSTSHKFATSAQLGLADTSVQPGDGVSTLNNDANYTSSGDNISVFTNDANYIDASGAPVQSVKSNWCRFPQC